MDKQELETDLKTLVATFTKDPAAVESLHGGSRLIDDLGIDSARMVDIWLDVEDRYKISIEESTIDKLVTFDDLVAEIESQLSKKGPGNA